MSKYLTEPTRFRAATFVKLCQHFNRVIGKELRLNTPLIFFISVIINIISAIFILNAS